VRDVNVFDDSKLVVQQINRKSQCLDGMLNEYRDMCLDIIHSLASFHIN
jgi:hypothetical protein